MRSSLIVIYLSVFVCLFVCLSLRSSYWPALKRSGLQNFSVNGHFAHYKPTKKRLWKPKNQKLFAVAVLAFQLQLQLRLQLQLQRCQKSLFSSFGAHFWSFYAWHRVEWQHFLFSHNVIHFMSERLIENKTLYHQMHSNNNFACTAEYPIIEIHFSTENNNI